MLLSLSLDILESFNRKEPTVITQSLERVVSIESDRYVEQLFEDMVMRISDQFDFEKKKSNKNYSNDIE